MVRRFAGSTLALWAFVSLVVLYSIAPVIVALGTSFTTSEYPVFPPVGFTLHWYEVFLGNKQFLNGLQLSIELATAAGACSCLIALATSYAIVRYDFRGKDALNSLLMAPILLPEIIVGVSLFEFLVFLRIFATLGVWGLFAGHIVITLPYAIRMTSSALTKVDVSLERAAAILGAKFPRVFRSIILPLISPSVFASFMFTFVLSFDDIPVSIFLTQGTTNPFPIVLMNTVEMNVNPSVGAAAVFFVALATGLLILFEKTVGLEFALRQ